MIRLLWAVERVRCGPFEPNSDRLGVIVQIAGVAQGTNWTWTGSGLASGTLVDISRDVSSVGHPTTGTAHLPTPCQSSRRQQLQHASCIMYQVLRGHGHVKMHERHAPSHCASLTNLSHEPLPPAYLHSTTAAVQAYSYVCTMPPRRDMFQL